MSGQTLFASDLDNTLIYSYKREIGKEKVLVELYEGREISYMTKKSHQLLQNLHEKEQQEKTMQFVPLTTRSTAQYERIFFSHEWSPHLALTANGGTLLVDGVEDMAWRKETLELIADAKESMKEVQQLLEKDPKRTLDVRFVNDLFLFTKSQQPEESLQRLRETCDGTHLSFFQNGVKVYAIPTILNKGTALQRLKKRLHPSCTIAAGDSDFDLPMLRNADVAFAPEALKEMLITSHSDTGYQFAKEEEFLSEKVLSYLVEKL
ncbi:MAG: HAD family hydrolase [Lachnospiraceae bacterium]